MIVAVWSVDAKFGHKQEVIKLLKEWDADIARQIGWGEKKMRMLVGSVGAGESTIRNEVELDDLSDLDASWKKLEEVRAMGDWAGKLEPHIVSGSNRWDVYRVV